MTAYIRMLVENDKLGKSQNFAVPMTVSRTETRTVRVQRTPIQKELLDELKSKLAERAKRMEASTWRNQQD